MESIQMYWWTYLQGSSGEADIENRLLDTVGKGEDGINRESSSKYIHYHVWNRQLSGELLCNTGSSPWRGGMGWEMGGRFKREGTCVPQWLIHVDIWQKPTQNCKAMIVQLKINLYFKKVYSFTSLQRIFFQFSIINWYRKHWISISKYSTLEIQRWTRQGSLSL